MPHPTADQHFNQAVQHHQRGELAEARAAYEQCLAMSPDHPFALTNLGSICRQQGEMVLALEYLRCAVVRSPQDPNAHFNLGNALRETGEIQAAVTSYRQALSIEPKASGCWYNLALALTDSGDTEAVRHAYTQAIATAPERLDARLNLAASYSSKGELTQARAILVEVLRLKPDYACETLWLGVPLVTCTGKEGGDFAPRFASRMGKAFLNNIGVPELACASITGYIDTAVRLAHDRPRLTALRQSLRDKMAHAPLTDEARFAREMEQAYRAMWREWGGTE